MKNMKPKLLTIISESAIEALVLKEIESLGAHGYTVTPAKGKGTRGVRDAAWETSSNVRIEIICDAKIAKLIATSLKGKYYKNYAMILYMMDVEVLRPEKF